MTNRVPVNGENLLLSRTTAEIVIRVGVMVALAAWCFWLTRPFIFALVWGLIIAVAAYPSFVRIRDWLGGRGGLAATLLTALILVVLIVPVAMLTTILVSNLSELADKIASGSTVVPVPPPELATWPLVGPKLFHLWTLASSSLASALQEVRPQLVLVTGWLLSLTAGLGLGLLNFIAAAVIAGLILPRSASGHRTAVQVTTRLVGERGPGLALLAEHTIRNVVRGVFGTALIQSTIAGVGFVVVGVSWPAILALACFLLCLVQIGPTIVLLGTVIYVFSTDSALIGGIYLVWCIGVALLDNVLKPLLIGRGSEVPLPVILLGVLGGLLVHGLIGLFVGPIVLALGYQLFLAWLHGGHPKTGTLLAQAGENSVEVKGPAGSLGSWSAKDASPASDIKT
jgi:predicted PurR-regulated permease PerM